MSTARKRTKLYVDRRVQGILIRQLVVHWVTASLAMFLFLLIMQVFSSPEQLPVTDHLRALWSRYGVLAIAIGTVFPVFVYDSIKLSNRFAGPMVSFRHALGKLARGEEMNLLAFRTKDFWHEISVDLNAVARRMDLLCGDQNVPPNNDQPASS